jgi:hypothetical protein
MEEAASQLDELLTSPDKNRRKSYIKDDTLKLFINRIYYFIRLWGEVMAQNNDISYTRSSAAKIMVQSWNEVSKDCLIKAWENIITNQE